MSTPETTYYQDGSITVTNARAVLGSKTYAMANITSVSMGEIPANRTVGIVIAVIGLAILACSASGGSDGAGGIIGGLLLQVLAVSSLISPRLNMLLKLVVPLENQML